MIKKILWLLLISTALSQNDFDRLEVNTFVQVDNITFGTREYINHDYLQRIIRYEFENTPFRVEYRKIKKENRNEDWYRFQWKNLKYKKLFYNSRFEHRFRELKDDVFRYRPQFGYKESLFIIFEPHFQYTYIEKKSEYSHMQTKVGFTYKYKMENCAVQITPYIEIDTNSEFGKDVIFPCIKVKVRL